MASRSVTSAMNRRRPPQGHDSTSRSNVRRKSVAQSSHGPSACEASSLRYEGLARGRGPSVTGCLCTDGGVSAKLEPRFHVDVPVVDGIVGLLVLCVEVAGLFAFVYAPFGAWRFIASRRSSAVPAGSKE
jgi:hypothetical protein